MYKESIGKVVGDNGKTYKPIGVTQDGEGKVQFTFGIYDTTSQDLENEFSLGSLTLPYYTPIVVERDGQKYIHFEYNSDSLPRDIDFTEIKGDTGHSTIGIKFLTEAQIEAINSGTIPNDLEDNVIYIRIDTDDDADDNIENQIDAYVLREREKDSEGHFVDSTPKKLVKINSVINLSEYYTKTQVDNYINELKSLINNGLENAKTQQQNIYDTLTNGVIMQDGDYTQSNYVVNVMSDSSVEEMKEEILQQLQAYVLAEDVQLEDGQLVIKR